MKLVSIATLIITILLIIITLFIVKKKKHINIGILLNYPFLELYKDELVIPNSKSPQYIKNIPKYYLVNSKDSYGYPYDVVIGYYIKYTRPDINVNFIYPDTISVDEFKKNDIVFVLIYDLIEALNIDSMVGAKSNVKFHKNQFNRLKKVLETADNVYPPYDYQKLFNSKCKYYKFLNNNKIPIESTVCVSTKNKTEFIKNITEHIYKHKLKSFITKPDGGQEAIKFKVWKKVVSYKKDDSFRDEIYFKDLEELAVKLSTYYDSVVHFSKIIVQNEIKGFSYYGKLVPFNKVTSELKTYYVGDKYAYSVLLDRYCWRQPVVDGGSKKKVDCFKLCNNDDNCLDPCSKGTLDRPCDGPDISSSDMKRIKNLCNKILDILPKIRIKGVELPRLLTRIDVAVEASYYSKAKDGQRQLYINEIEFVPSLFHANIKYDAVGEVAKQLLKIVEIYNKSKLY